MPVKTLDFAEPFFTVRIISCRSRYRISGKSILLNLAAETVRIRNQQLGELQSAIVKCTPVDNVVHAVVVERFADYDDEHELMARIRTNWPSAFEVRGEERLRGIEHYMSPKVWVGQFGFTMYHCATVPVTLGLHREHSFCPVPGFREVHTQIVGFGKMQQCRERDIETLYLEEPMAPGTTHRPMYNAEGRYPWHQFETITPSVFMAVEMLPDGVAPPAL